MVKSKLTEEEIREWIRKHSAVKPEIMKELDSMKKAAVLAHVNKPNMLRLLQVYKDKAFTLNKDADWHVLCHEGSLCGIDTNNNPTGRQAIMCADECPLVPRKE